MSKLWMVAWLLWSAASQASEDPVLDLARGEHAFVLTPGEARDVRLAVPAGVDSSLHVVNFGPQEVTLEAVSPALGTMPFAPHHVTRRLPLASFGVESVTFRLRGEGDVWLLFAHGDGESEQLVADLGPEAVIARGHHHLRVADTLIAQGDMAGASQRSLWGAGDFRLAGRDHEVLRALQGAAPFCVGTPHEAEILHGIMLREGKRGLVVEERTRAERLVELLADAVAPDDRQRRYDARMALARRADSPSEGLSHATAALEEVGDASVLQDHGLDGMLTCVEWLIAMGEHDDAGTRWIEAVDRGRLIADPAVVGGAFARAFDRARERFDVDAAARALRELESTERSTQDAIHDCGRRAQLAEMQFDSWSAIEHWSDGLRLAADAEDVTLEVMFGSLKGRALARLGFGEQGRDVVSQAAERARELPASESTYLALRSMGVIMSETLGRETDGVDAFAWTRRWRGVHDVFARAHAMAEALNSPKMLGDVSYLLAAHYSKDADQLATATRFAERALGVAGQRDDRVLAAASEGLLTQMAYERGAAAADVIGRAQSVVASAVATGQAHHEINARAFVAELALDMGDLALVGQQAAKVRALASKAVRGVRDVDHLSRRFAQYDFAHWSYIDQDWAAARIGVADDVSEMIDAGARAADRWSLLGVVERLPDVSVDDVASSLAPDTIVVRYASGKGRLYAYVVSRDGGEHHTVDDLQGLQERVAAYRRGLSDREELYDVDEVALEGHVLWKTLVADLVGPRRLATCRRLIIVPTPWLSHLPFEALVHEARTDVSTFADVPFVLTQFDVQYASSLAAIVPGRSEAVATARSLLVTGAPDYDSAGASGERRGEFLAELPHARTEAHAIKALGGANVELRLGALATREGVLEDLHNFDVLHFALHGLVGDDPRDSGLAFVDGLLSAEDIRRLALSSELVVLSACDTAVGLERPSQRVDSLATAFASAGARGVVATLWTVQDATTAALMMEFYGAYLDDSIAPAEALTRARRHVLATSVDDLKQSVAAIDGLVPRGGRLRDADVDIPDGHPHLWASFIYTGAMRR